MTTTPREITDIIENCKLTTAQYREALALATQAGALSPQLSIWLRVEDDLSSALLDAERNAAIGIAEHARRVLGPPGLPLPADTFADLLPDHMGRHERRALVLRDLNHPPEARTTLDLEALWPAMLARFPSQDAAHETARADLARRFRGVFFGRRYPAPEPHRDGIKLKLYAAQEAYSFRDPKYCFDSATRLLEGLDLIRAIAGEAGITVPVGQLHAWQRERPYFPHQRLDAGPVQVLCRKDYFELQMGRDLARAINLFLAAHGHEAAIRSA
jgi:hypothetical protein